MFENGLLTWLKKQREAALAGLIVVLLIVIGLRAPEFLALKNLDNLLTNASVLVMLVVGQLLVMLTRGIDLSPAAALAFTGMFLALLSQAYPTLPAVVFLVLALTMGLALGAVNGGLVAVVRIPPIIVTLGTMTIYRGLIFIFSDGAWVSAHEMSENFKTFPLARWAVLPNIIWVATMCAALAWVFLKYTRTGRALYAVGGNPLAARFAGISLPKIEFLVYCLSGMIAGLVGYLWTARFAIAYTQAAEGREFAIIAACVIGGVSIAGGKGTVPGVVLGALFLTIIESALPFVRVNPFLQTAISGCIILIAVVVNSRVDRSSGRRILAPSDQHPTPAAHASAERTS